MRAKDQDNLELIYAEIKEKLELQRRLGESLDTKGSIVLGFTGVIMAVLLGVELSEINLFFFVPSLILLLSTIILIASVYKTEFFREDPNPEALMKLYWRKERSETIEVLIVNLVDSYNYNRPILSKKATKINSSLFLLLVALFLSTLSVLI